MASNLTLYDPAPARDVQPKVSDFVVRTTNGADDQWDCYLSPTIEAYGELQVSYSHFNKNLFDGRLPNCLLTLQRKGERTYGYFAPDRFANHGGRVTDEIALNPRLIKHRSFLEVMSTLVHEMVHLWQHHYGRPSRNGYHNREWAQKMRDVGLRPSHTGALGGRQTGQQMTHYIIAGGAFEVAARALQASPIVLSWFDADGVFIFRPKAAVEMPRMPEPGSRRTKFTCPVCTANAWGKPSLHLRCDDCDQPLLPA